MCDNIENCVAMTIPIKGKIPEKRIYGSTITFLNAQGDPLEITAVTFDDGVITGICKIKYTEEEFN